MLAVQVLTPVLPYLVAAAFLLGILALARRPWREGGRRYSPRPKVHIICIIHNINVAAGEK